jgi:glycosyltransferase-like protein LARGE
LIGKESRATHLKQLMDGGKAALVIPAFEFTQAKEGVDPTSFPKDKTVSEMNDALYCLSFQALKDLVDARKVGMFHASWPPGHNSTDYERYFTAEPGEVYAVSQYQHAYEPYIIFKKDIVPWWVRMFYRFVFSCAAIRCAERFVGYGANKAACLFEFHISGVTFYVLSDDFVIHQSHSYAEHVRKSEVEQAIDFRSALIHCTLAKIQPQTVCRIQRRNMSSVCQQLSH